MPVRADVDMATADPCMQKALKAVDDPYRIVTPTNQRFITENTNERDQLAGRAVLSPTIHDGGRGDGPVRENPRRTPTRTAKLGRCRNGGAPLPWSRGFDEHLRECRAPCDDLGWDVRCTSGCVCVSDAEEAAAARSAHKALVSVANSAE